MSYTNHLIDSYHRIEKFRKKSDMSWMEKVSIIYSYRIYIFRLNKNICFVKLYSRMLLNSSRFFTIFALCPPLLLPHRFMGQLCLTPRSPGGSLFWQWLLERLLSYGAGRQHYWPNLSNLPSPVIACLKKFELKILFNTSAITNGNGCSLSSLLWLVAHLSQSLLFSWWSFNRKL